MNSRSVFSTYKMRRTMCLATSILLSIFMWACSQARQTEEGPIEWQCPALPGSFTDKDLLGTWRAEYGRSVDILVLNNDGTYDQMYTRLTDGYSFRNTGNKWRIETASSGGHYLHLTNMRRCDYFSELCQNEAGGGADISFWDFCTNRLVEMPGEVILIVTGVPRGGKPTPRDIWLWHMSPNPEAGSYHFELVEE